MPLEPDPTLGLTFPEQEAERTGLLERAETEGVGGLVAGIADMFLPRAGTTGTIGLGDLLSQYVEFSRIGDVFDVAAAINPESGLDPLERAIAALPLIGGGVATGYAATKTVRRYQRRRAQLAQFERDSFLASMLPAREYGLDEPADRPVIGIDRTPEQMRETARFFSQLQFEHTQRQAAALWQADDWDSLIETWAPSSSESAKDALKQMARGIGQAVVAADPDRYAPEADIETKIFVAAKHAIARWESARNQGLIRLKDRNLERDLVTPPDYEGSELNYHKVPSVRAAQAIASLEIALGKIAGPDNVVSPHTRIARVEFDTEAMQATPILVPDPDLLPARVWDWDMMRPLDEAAVMRRLNKIDYGALTGQFASNLLKTLDRIPPDTAGRGGDIYTHSAATWYWRANRTIRTLAEDTGVDPWTISGVFSAISAQTAWAPDNIVGALHSVLRFARPDLRPGSPEYVRIFRRAVEAGDWQHDLFMESSRQLRAQWAGTPLREAPTSTAGLDSSAFEAMFDHYANPDNVTSAAGNIRGVTTATDKRKLAALLEAGLPPSMVLRMLKTGTFAQAMFDPDGRRWLAVIDRHSDAATMGSAWLRFALGQKYQREIGGPRQAQSFTDPVTGFSFSMEEVESWRPKLKELGWDEKEIDSFFESLRKIPDETSQTKFLAQVDAHVLLADYLGADAAHQVQAASWAHMRGLDYQNISKSIEKLKDLDEARALARSLTWDDSIPRLLEGNAFMERSIVGMVWEANERHDGYMPETLETLDEDANPVVVIPREHGGVDVWANREAPGVADYLRHVTPTGLKIGKRELHVRKRPRRVRSVEQHAKEARQYTTAAGEQAAGIVTTYLPDQDFQHPALVPGEYVAVTVDPARRQDVVDILDTFETYLPYRTVKVRRWHTRPAVRRVSSGTLAQLRGQALQRFLRENDWFTISAERSGLEPAENAKRTRRLISRLDKLGAGYVKVQGYWMGEAETSFLVTGLTHEQRVRLMEEFDQDAIAVNGGIINRDGSFDQAVGMFFGSDARAQLGYTVLPNGEAFSLDFEGSSADGDFDPTDRDMLDVSERAEDIVIEVGGRYGGLHWRQTQDLVNRLREFGNVRIYSHSPEWRHDGFVQVTESVFTDDSGMYGSVFHGGETDHRARHQAMVWMPEEDAAGLGAEGWEGERSDRNIDWVNKLLHWDEQIGEVYVDEDLILRFDGEFEIVEGDTLFERVRPKGRPSSGPAVLDLNGPVPVVYMGRDLPGPQPGLVPLTIHRGKVRDIHPFDPNDWVDAKEALASLGVLDRQPTLKLNYIEGMRTGAEAEIPEVSAQLDFAQAVTRRPDVRRIVDEDRDLAMALSADLGVPVRVRLGQNFTPELRDQFRQTLVSLFSENEPHPAFKRFRERFGSIPPQVVQNVPIESADLFRWTGAGYEPVSTVEAFHIPARNPESVRQLVLNERFVYHVWAAGKQYRWDRWFRPLPPGVSQMMRTLVHELAHAIHFESGWNGIDLAKIGDPAHEYVITDLGEYAATRPDEYVAEVLTKAILEPDKLAPEQVEIAEKVLHGVRAKYIPDFELEE